jgi:hypothetical protein
MVALVLAALTGKSMPSFVRAADREKAPKPRSPAHHTA